MASTSNPGSTEPLATIEDVRFEMNLPPSDSGDEETISDDAIERALGQATRFVARRLPTERDEAHLADLQALVAAHFLHPRVTGAFEGREVSSVAHGSARTSFETSGALGPGEYGSPYWDRALMLEPRLGDTGTDWFFETF
jgi:hypothetical protein